MKRWLIQLIMALVICSSASAEDLRCSASNDMTVHPFSEISEAQAKIYMPNLKQFDSSLFEPIPDYDSKLYVESVDGHRNQTQKINWRLLPSGKILAIAKWPVDNWMGHFELKRRYSCVEVSDSTIQSAGAGASGGAGVLDTSEVPLEDFTHFRKATLYTSNKENNTLIAFNEKKANSSFFTSGKVLLDDEWCASNTVYNTSQNTGTFRLECASGYQATGKFVPLGEAKGATGSGKDIFGNAVKFRVHPARGTHEISKSDFLYAVRNWKRVKTEKVNATTNQAQSVNVDFSVSSAFQSITNVKIHGMVKNKGQLNQLEVAGKPVFLDENGVFETSFYVPRDGVNVEVTAVAINGSRVTKILELRRGENVTTMGPTFAALNPSLRSVSENKNALALIIGVADYERTTARAAYADKDAQTFYDYATLKLGVLPSNVKELLNKDANEVELRLAITDWLARSTVHGQTDVYVFFAGHGLANQSGDEMYLLPVDGEPRLLDDTAISRERLFADISAANPRSVTVFLDTCYSGTTRGTDMLIASRPIAIRALEQSIPDNFTVMTAAAGDQTAKPLEEAKHGMFSYFLMKGMEGEADANNDNEITAGELHSYVQTNVIQQSSGSQTPELQGDADRVLVRFQ